MNAAAKDDTNQRPVRLLYFALPSKIYYKETGLIKKKKKFS